MKRNKLTQAKHIACRTGFDGRADYNILIINAIAALLHIRTFLLARKLGVAVVDPYTLLVCGDHASVQQPNLSTVKYP